MPEFDPAPLPLLDQPGCPPEGQGPSPPQDPDDPWAWAMGGWSDFATRTPNYLDRQNTLGSQTPDDGRPAYASGWDANTCGVAQCGIEYRKSRVLCHILPECNDDPATTDTHPGIERAQLRTMHPVRAMDLTGRDTMYPDPHEPCRYHKVYSEVVNGRRRAIGCSGRLVISHNDVAPAQGASVGKLSVRKTTDNLGRAGRSRVLWSFKNPHQNPVLLTSPRCWGWDQDNWESPNRGNQNEEECVCAEIL